ncbi:MAG: hypothetical protein L3K18_09585 [Thermoplasmata archaeon]|nr:hypothetical protein [Thermoplasmata archaeon]
MTKGCARGCKNPDGSPKNHWRVAECPVYQQEAAAERRKQGEKSSATAAPPDPKAPQPKVVPPVAPSGSGGLSFTGGTAETRKGSTVPTPPPEPVDYKIDVPHTRTLWNNGYRGLKGVLYSVDDWLQTDKIHKEGFTRHIPEGFFRLTPNDLSTIDGDPEGNPYTGLGTRFCKMVGCKTRAQAHGLIDGMNFLMLFGALAYVMVAHYRVAISESPKLASMKLKKKEAAAKKKNVADAEFRSVDSPAVGVGAAT